MTLTPPPVATAVAAPTSLAGHPAAGAAGRPSAAQVLDRLRVASIERLVSELGRHPPGATRRQVLEELRCDPRVRWFGQSLVARTGEGS